ncbi:MAG: DEAD/DEAH box helicase [Myxococcota bacterium]
MSFDALGLAEPLLRAVREQGYTAPTPIQVDAIPHVLAGRDLLGVAQTGTGKTAAFGLPLLQQLAAKPAKARPGRPRALVLTPTRELAIQIDQSFADYGRHLGLRHAVIFGGVGQAAQEKALRAGLDVLTATPGRLLDLQGQGFVHFDAVELFVLDEADRMLDLGFLPDVRRVLQHLPKQRQSLFFSATMPPSITALAATILTEPVRVEVVPESTPAERILQRVLFVDPDGKKEVIAKLVSDPRVDRALVFTRTNHRANRVAQLLERAGVKAAAIHGNTSQNARQRALEGFRDGTTPVLVATDIAARGIDVEGISHVVNFDLPNVPESYVHRIGRTARAGASGMALSLCDREEIAFLRDIEKLIGKRIDVAGDRIGLPDDVLQPGPLGAERRQQAAPKAGGGGKRSGRRGGRRRP